MTVEMLPCRRCGGSGWIPRFGHVLKGICFQCNGSGKTRQRVRPDGTIDHDHRTAMTSADRCILCDLPVADWPTLVPAHWYGDLYEVFLPGGRELVPAATRREGQTLVRALVAERVGNARVKWVNR